MGKDATRQTAAVRRDEPAAEELRRHLRMDSDSLQLAIDSGEVARLVDQIKRDHPHLWPNRNTHS